VIAVIEPVKYKPARRVSLKSIDTHFLESVIAKVVANVFKEMAVPESSGGFKTL